ncbi:MAG: hypothetical protein CMG75_07670 [Candidatus Marinimicrobia bacterium]|nr:hypothetical protein [Candidatus Neomarinimicrobiota bacterium]
MSQKISVTLSSFCEFGSEPIEILKKSDYNFEINQTGKRLNPFEIKNMCSDSIGIIAGIETYNQDVLKNLNKLKCISRAGVGIDSIDLEFAKENGISIRNTPEVVIQPVLELTLSLLFGLLRKTHQHTNLMKEKKWNRIVGENLKNKNVGIIGTGRIGKIVCQTISNLGGNILPYDIQPDTNWSKKNKFSYVTLSYLITNSDIISIHSSSKVNTFPIIGKNEIRKMKKGVIIINTSRGNLLDEESIYLGLQSGKIGSIGLDVFEEEPYYGKLLEFDSVLFTPHIATFTRESRMEMETQATINLIEELRNIN